MNRDVQAEIRELVHAAPVVLFMKGTPEMPMCGFSARTVQALRSIGAEFRTVNVLADPEVREAVKSYANWPTIPQLYVKGEFVGGCDIAVELVRTGELAKRIASLD